MLIYVAPYFEHMSDLALQSEYFLVIGVYSSVLFSLAWEKMVHYGVLEGVMIIIIFGVMFLLCVIYIIYLLTEKKMPCRGEISEWIWGKLTAVAAFIFFIVPSLHVTLLYVAFGAARGGFFVAIMFPVCFFMSFFCLVDLNKGKCCSDLLSKTAWITLTFMMIVAVINFCIKTMENEKDVAAGWICTTVFQQVLWMIAIYNHSNEDLDLTLTLKKILYALGSIGIVLLNAVALMTEMILKTVNGERAVGDLRVVVFSSESIFTLSLLILLMFGCYMKSLQCCQEEVRFEDIPATDTEQNYYSQTQNAAASDETPANRSNQNQNATESHEMNPVLNQDKEAGVSDTAKTKTDSGESQTFNEGKRLRLIPHLLKP